MRKKKEQRLSGDTLYTDDPELAKNARGTEGLHVVYQGKPNPFLVYAREDGSKISKWNPEYVEYLKRKNPGISEQEISNHMKELSEEKKENEEMQR